jgi:hypothetical protein
MSTPQSRKLSGHGFKDVIPACPESFFALLYCRVLSITSEGFPTSGNDRMREYVYPDKEHREILLVKALLPVPLEPLNPFLFLSYYP